VGRHDIYRPLAAGVPEIDRELVTTVAEVAHPPDIAFQAAERQVGELSEPFAALAELHLLISANPEIDQHDPGKNRGAAEQKQRRAAYEIGAERDLSASGWRRRANSDLGRSEMAWVRLRRGSGLRCPGGKQPALAHFVTAPGATGEI